MRKIVSNYLIRYTIIKSMLELKEVCMTNTIQAPIQYNRRYVSTCYNSSFVDNERVYVSLRM